MVTAEGCGGDGVRIAKDNQGPKGNGLGRWGEGIQIQETRIHSGLRSVKSLLSALEVGLSLPPALWAT